MATLLEKALAAQQMRHKTAAYNEQDHELVEAWLDGRISLKQVAAARRVAPDRVSKLYCYIALVAREIRQKAKESK